MSDPKKKSIGTSGSTYYLPDQVKIVTDTKHPLFDERINLPIDPNMVKNVIMYGVLEPVICVREGEEILVADGRQRVRWTAAANEILAKEGKEPIKFQVVFRRGDNRFQMGIMIAANERAEKDGPLVRAQKMQRLLDMGRTEEEAAVTFVVSGQAIRNWKALLECCPKVKAAVDAGKVPASIAIKLSKLSVEEQEKALAEMLETGATGGARAKQIADRANAGTKKPKKKKARQAVDLDSEEEGEEEAADDDAPVVSVLGKKMMQGIAKRLRSHPFDFGLDPSEFAAHVLDYITGKSSVFAQDFPWHATGEGKEPSKKGQ